MKSDANRKRITRLSFFAGMGFVILAGCARMPVSSEDVWPVRADNRYSRDGTADWIRSGTQAREKIPSRRTNNPVIPYSGPKIIRLKEDGEPKPEDDTFPELKIEADLSSSAGKGRILRIRLENTGKEAVFAARRFQVGTDLILVVRGEPGEKSIACLAPREISTPAEQGTEFILLAPGASFERKINITSLFPGTVAKGSYILHAKLRNADWGPGARLNTFGDFQPVQDSPYQVWVGEKVFAPLPFTTP